MYFSPWNDSVAFIAHNVYVNMEPWSVGGRVENIYQPAWPVAGGIGVEESQPQPASYALFQNYPNPFNPATSIRFKVQVSRHVVLKVFDLLGREVATLVNEELPPGSYARTFDAAGLASGVYLYRMQPGSFVQTRKLIVLR